MSSGSAVDYSCLRACLSFAIQNFPAPEIERSASLGLYSACRQGQGSTPVTVSVRRKGVRRQGVAESKNYPGNDRELEEGGQNRFHEPNQIAKANGRRKKSLFAYALPGGRQDPHMAVAPARLDLQPIGHLDGHIFHCEHRDAGKLQELKAIKSATNRKNGRKVLFVSSVQRMPTARKLTKKGNQQCSNIKLGAPSGNFALKPSASAPMPCRDYIKVGNGTT
uniref:Uncharacterized protein n=1 Tax=Trichuris muris TaxID=70415 RepID=A0A5S6QYR4_TRIMR